MLVLSVSLVRAEWPTFRGPHHSGIGEGRAVTSWNADATAGPLRNVSWRTPIPGLSHSSPVIWGDRIYVATVVSSAGEAPLKVGIYGAGDPANDDGAQTWKLLCLDRSSGRVLWQRDAHQGKPRTRRHTKATHLNTTPVTDGRRIALFLGSEGLFVFSMEGRLLWRKDLARSTRAPRDTICSGVRPVRPPCLKTVSFCNATRKKRLSGGARRGGRPRTWRVNRDGVSNHSWATPVVVRTAGRRQVVCNGWPFITSYDLGTGRELWRSSRRATSPCLRP